jgi:large subunit ribosomal protein L17
MRHQKSGLKLSRTSSHRDAMFRNMTTSLFKYGRIKTTDVKAKELRRWADRLITLAKKGDLHARRQALSILREKNVVHQLFLQVQERFGELAGGYTKLTKIGTRKGDAALMTMIELSGKAVELEEKPKPAKDKKTKTKEAAKTEEKEAE